MTSAVEVQWDDLAALARSLPAPGDVDARVADFSSKKAYTSSGKDVPLPELVQSLRDCSGHASVKSDQLSQLVQATRKLTKLCAPLTTSESEQNASWHAILVAFVCHLCVLASAQSSTAAGNATAGKRQRGKQAKETGKCSAADLCGLLQDLACIVMAVMPALQATLAAEQLDRLLSFCAKAALAVCSATQQQDKLDSAACASVLPIMQQCTQVRATADGKHAWTMPEACSTLLEGVESKDLYTLLSYLLASHAKSPSQNTHLGAEQAQAGALVLELRMRLSQCLAVGNSSKVSTKQSSTGNASAAAQLLRAFASASPAMQAALTPPDVLSTALGSKTAAVRKAALISCKDQLLAMLEHSSPNGTEFDSADNSSAASNANFVHGQVPSLSMQATAASKNAVFGSAPPPPIHIAADKPVPSIDVGINAKLSRWLALQITSTMQADADANARKLAATCAVAICCSAIKLVAQCSTQQTQHAVGAAQIAAAAARTLAAAAQDSSKVVRSDALKGLQTVCHALPAALTATGATMAQRMQLALLGASADAVHHTLFCSSADSHEERCKLAVPLWQSLMRCHDSADSLPQAAFKVCPSNCHVF